MIREGETLAEVKARIQKKLQVSDEEFSKVCFIFLPGIFSQAYTKLSLLFLSCFFNSFFFTFKSYFNSGSLHFSLWVVLLIFRILMWCPPVFRLKLSLSLSLYMYTHTHTFMYYTINKIVIIIRANCKK